MRRLLIVLETAKRLPYSDHIIVLNAAGEIDGQGTFAELNNAGGYVSSFSLSRADWSTAGKQETLDGASHLLAESGEKKQTDKGDDQDNIMQTLNSAQHREFAGGESTTNSSSNHIARPTPAAHDGVGESVDRASRSTGDIQIYLYYIKSVGWWACLLFVVAMVGFVFCMSFPSKLLPYSVLVSFGTDTLFRCLGPMVGCCQRGRPQRPSRVLARCVCCSRRRCTCLPVSQLLVSSTTPDNRIIK